MIRASGAREHTLRGIDVTLPDRALVVLTGVSGSGKSSLAFDTLHAEGQRRYLEALGIRQGGLRQPDVDLITGLPPTIGLDQRSATPSSRATVASLAEVHPVLRVLFGRAGVQHCPVCDRIIQPRTHDEIVAELLTLEEGTRLLIESPVRVQGDPAGVVDEVGRAGFSRIRLGEAVRRLEQVAPAELEGVEEIAVVVDRIKVSADRRDRLHDAVRTAAQAGRGVVVAVTTDTRLVFVDRPYCVHDRRALLPLRPQLFSDRAEGACPSCAGSGRVEAGTCPDCEGTRLGEDARAVRFAGQSLPEVLAHGVSALRGRARAWPRDAVTEVVLADLLRRLEVLEEVGLGGLELDRSATALSTGELQCLRLGRQVGARLSGVLYVLDEPTAGLDPDRVGRVIELLRRLRDQGNSVLVVAHHPEVIEAADRVIDFGPGPGHQGGTIVYEGDVAGLKQADTVTGAWLSGRATLSVRAAEPAGWVEVTGAPVGDAVRDVRMPLGALGVITGPTASGKTTLLELFRHHVAQHLRLENAQPPPVDAISGLESIERMVVVDRRQVPRASRSNAATYTGVWQTVRDLLASTREARLRGMGPAFFSLNVKGGRCEACSGAGVSRIDLHLLPDVWVECEVCRGRRFNADVLQVTWKGRSPDEILALEAAEAHAFLAGHPRIEAGLRALVDVGLGYLPLGQPAHTLSGGEANRLKLARELARANRRGAAGTVYLIDGPAQGLHPADVSALYDLLRRLIDEGATVWLATHHPGLVDAADHVVRL